MKKPVVLTLAAALMSGCGAVESTKAMPEQQYAAVTSTDGCWEEQRFNLLVNHNLIHFISAAELVEVHIRTVRQGWEVELSHGGQGERHLVPADVLEVLSANAFGCGNACPNWVVTITPAAFMNEPRAIGRIRWRRSCDV